MLTNSLHTLMLAYSLIFTAAGFVLGLFYHQRKVVRLEDKVARLKRTVAHLQRKLKQPSLPVELPATARPIARRGNVISLAVERAE